MKLEEMTEFDWTWAHNMNAFLDEAVMALTIPTEARAAGNPFEHHSVSWYRWEKAIKQYDEYLAELAAKNPEPPVGKRGRDL